MCGARRRQRRQTAPSTGGSHRHFGVKVTIVLDLIHVLKYLWKASYVFYAEGSAEAEAWERERLLWLMCGDVGHMIASIRRTATLRVLSRVGPREGLLTYVRTTNRLRERAAPF